jgi:hypothetical protein
MLPILERAAKNAGRSVRTGLVSLKKPTAALWL